MRKAFSLAALLLLLPSLSSAATITFQQPDSSVDVFTQTVPAHLDVEVPGYDGQLEYSLNGGERKDCGCRQGTLISGVKQGDNTVTVYAGEDSRSLEFRVDTEKPRIESVRPKRAVFKRYPELIATYHDKIGGVNASEVSLSIDNETVNVSAGEDSLNLELSNISEGNHTATLRVPDVHATGSGTHTAVKSWWFRIPEEPVVSGLSPEGTVDGSVTLEATARDPSGIDLAATYVSLESRDYRRILSFDELKGSLENVSSGVSFSYGLENLSDGVYDVEVHAVDGNGNEAVRGYSFTVDTTPPSLKVLSHVSGDVITKDEVFRFRARDGLSEVEEVKFEIGGSSFTADDAGGEFTRKVDTRELPGGEVELVVEASDTGGNTASRTITLVVDNEKPSIPMEDIEVYPNPAAGDIVLEATVIDSSTSVGGAWYEVDGTDIEGRMDAVNGGYDSRRERVREVVDLEGLETGDHTVFFSAIDSAGHRVSGLGEDFTLDRNLETDLAVSPDSVTVEVGSTTSFDLTVSNNGEVDEMVSLSADSGLVESIEPDHRRIESGESKNFVLNVSLPDEESFAGLHTLNITVDGLSYSSVEGLDVIVQPHPERVAEIEARFDNLMDRFEDINDSADDWELRKNLSDEFRETRSIMSRVEGLMEEGRYARASGLMDRAENQVSETRSSFTSQVTRQRIDRLTSLALKVLALLAVLGVLYGGYRLIPPEEGYSPDDGFVHRPEGKHPLRARLERWMDRRGSDEEEEKGPSDWSGF
ncbi:MAG: Ig-like domain-containing protein [Candidatus Nanohaloarchaea archaeon]|nr:Ig-like domain-containing protein [Candidatus Nanohaloarchaea archaeon]